MRLATRHPRATRPRRERGFTMLELVVVSMILGAVILLVPMNMMGFGARTRLESAANSVVASLGGTRAKAVEDGYRATLEIGWVEENEEDRAAMRLKYTTIPVDKNLGDREESLGEPRIDRGAEREWAYTEWRKLPRGVVWRSVSKARGQWKRLSPGDKGYSITFFASGDVEHAVAIRLWSEDLDNVEDRYRIMTVVVNGLTSESSWVEGEYELREFLDDSHFNY